MKISGFINLILRRIISYIILMSVFSLYKMIKKPQVLYEVLKLSS